ncbi:MAG: hypothetical protein DMG63_14540 [Acidobacteria bacterium]|nr:MAG: hypothetical protein DMG63_14540 [Acidobacteriota bacterium]
MAHFAPPKPRDSESRETSTVPPGSVEFLLTCVEILKAQTWPKAILDRLAEQAHAYFYPLPVALITEEDGRLYLSAFASQDERSHARAIEQDLATPYQSLTASVRKALTEERTGLQSLELADTGFSSIFTAPIRTSQSSTVLALLLTSGQQLAEADRALVAALAQIASMALSDKEMSQLFMRITRSSRQWAGMFDSISDFMLLHDEHQRISRVNRSLSEKLGKHPAAVLGLPVRELFGLSSASQACPFCLDMRSGEFREEFREPKTGNIYLVSSSRLRGVGEDTQQTVHVLKDVTANRRAERLYRELFDNIQEGAYFSAPDGRLLEVNDALVRMLGYNSREELLKVTAHDLYLEPAEHDFNTQILNHTQSLIAVADTAGLVSYANRRCSEVAGGEGADLVGSRLETIVLESHRPVLRGAIECVLEGKAVNNLELPLARGRQTIGSFSVNLSPMRSPSGEVNSLVAVMTDITDVAILQAKLMHTEKMAAVGQLVSGVAHEVNNPLTAILGFADLLLENPELNDQVRDDLQVIVQESQRTREIVQNLLSFARQTPPEKHAVDVNQVVRRTIALRSYGMGSHGIELIERFDSTLPEIVGDAHQLQQVFLNILNNACDAVRETGRRGRIVIATEQSAGLVEVRFRDNGTGIRHPERIFDPFFTTKEVGKGTGLGLSICYGIVREHCGEIVCFNNQDSEGATFTIRLPLMKSKTGKAMAKAAACVN